MKEKLPEDIKSEPKQQELPPLSDQAAAKTLKPGENQIQDRDVHSPTRNNAEFIEQNNIKIFQETVEIKEEKFYINIFSKPGPNTQKYLVIHDSEDAAFDTGIRAIKDGGAMITLENQNGRNLYSFGNNQGDTGQDPNRIFDPNSRYWPLAQKLLKLLNGSSGEMMIALHNNRPEGDFDLDHLEEKNNISVLSRQDQDPKSMVLIPGTDPEPDQELNSEIQYYRGQGLNVVYEYVPEDESGDGSLSNYAAHNGLPYRNVEIPAATRGDQKSEKQSREKQTRYLDAIKNYHSPNRSYKNN